MQGIAGLMPGYFSLVMATGAVSIACQLIGWHGIAQFLLAVNIAAFIALWTLSLIRIIVFPSLVISDFADHVRGPGFFTIVAGTCVLGTQLIVVSENRGIAQWLWLIGTMLWFLVMYSFFTAVIVRKEKPTLSAGINGAWLLATVATQSVATLAMMLGDPLGLDGEVIAFGALVFFLIGCMLYLAIITLIFYRLTFLELDSAALTPPYWINMGAVAITTLAGATFLIRMSNVAVVAPFVPFVRGFTLFFWSAATWWIPALFLLGLWRHVWQRFPLKYDPQYWGMVFPLGMYTIATWNLTQAVGAEFLRVIPRVFIFLALAAWIITFLGMVSSWIRPSRSLPDKRAPH